MKKIGRRFMSKFFLYFRISEDQGVLTISNLKKKREIRREREVKELPIQNHEHKPSRIPRYLLSETVHQYLIVNIKSADFKIT